MTMTKARLIEIINTLPTSRKRQPLLDEQHKACRAAGFDPHGEIHLFYLSLLVADAAQDQDGPQVQTLRAELEWISASGWDFSHTVRYPHEAREFCSEEGGVRDLTEAQLSEPQSWFLFMIRKGIRRFCHENKIDYPFKPLSVVNG